MTSLQRLIVGISGASGTIFGIRLLEALRHTPIETHLVMTQAAHITLIQETSYTLAQVQALAHQHYVIKDIGAAIASGSFPTLGMIVLPCSVKSMAEIANGITSNLLTRAADVILKERKKLVLCVRESPLHLGHLRNMAALTEMGAIIAPPMPAFYPQPITLEDMIEHTIGRILDLFSIENTLAHRWQGLSNRSSH